MMLEKESTAIWLKKEKARKEEAKREKKEAEILRKASMSAELLMREEELDEKRRKINTDRKNGRITLKEANRQRTEIRREVEIIKKEVAAEAERRRKASMTEEEVQREATEKRIREEISMEKYRRRQKEIIKEKAIQKDRERARDRRVKQEAEAREKREKAWERARIEKLNESKYVDEVRKFRVKLYYKLLSEDTLLAIINYMGRAKENKTLRKSKEELRFLNLKQEMRYKFEYDLEVRLHCSNSEAERVELQTEIAKRERMLWENLDKLPQKELLERISALGRNVKTKEDISWGTLEKERGRKISGDAFEILASYMFKNDTTDKLILQLEEILTVESLDNYIEHRSNEVYSLDDRSKTIVNLSELEKLNVRYQTACDTEKLVLDELIQKAKIEESRHNIPLRLTTKGNYDGYRTPQSIEMEKINDVKLRKAELELYRYEYFHEYGVYPPERFKGTANDIIYLWKNQDGAYKIGVTSKRAGKSRIWKVAREGHMKAEIIYYEEVEDAILVENQLLKCGTKVHFKYKFDGSTEFRYLSEDDLEEVTNIVQKYQIGV